MIYEVTFSQDIIAFSCCVYDGGEEEKREMDKARERSWKGKFNKKGRVIMPGALRRDGKCPMTPIEVCCIYLKSNDQYLLILCILFPVYRSRISSIVC